MAKWAFWARFLRVYKSKTKFWIVQNYPSVNSKFMIYNLHLHSLQVKTDADAAAVLYIYKCENSGLRGANHYFKRFCVSDC